jgi:hypothetical protein
MLCRIAPATHLATSSQLHPPRLCLSSPLCRSNHYHLEYAPTTESPVAPTITTILPTLSPQPCQSYLGNATTFVLPPLYCPHCPHHYYYYRDHTHATTPTITSIPPSPYCCPNYHRLDCGHNVTQTSTTILTIFPPRPYRLNHHHKCREVLSELTPRLSPHLAPALRHAVSRQSFDLREVMI